MEKKRGEIGVGGLIVFIIVCILALPFIFLLSFVLSGSVEAAAINPEIKYRILAERFIEDKDCLAYQPEFESNLNNLISFEKFSQQQLDQCYYLLDDAVVPAFRIALQYQEGGNQKELSYQTKNWYGTKANLVVTKQVSMMKMNKLEKAQVVFYIKDGLQI